jgi:hypothetical protein
MQSENECATCGKQFDPLKEGAWVECGICETKRKHNIVNLGLSVMASIYREAVAIENKETAEQAKERVIEYVRAL